MEINVSQQLKEPVGSIRSYEVSEVVDTNGGSTVHGEVRLMRTNRGILVNGTLYTEVEITCSRCLNLFAYPLTLSIEEEYFPTTDVVSGTPLPLPEEPGCFTIDERHILDLTEAIRQYVLMATPMKPLCQEDCAGLCSNCGQNLNQGTCNCAREGVDPRWSELTKLALSSHMLENEQEGTE